MFSGFKMKMALVSIRPIVLDKQANIKKMEKYIKKIKADIYVFGELSLTGYSLKDEFRDVAEDINGDSIKKIKKLAEKNNCYIVFGMPLKDTNVEGLIHNSSILIHPDGKVDFYNKWFLTTFGPFEEKIFYDEGENFQIYDTKFGKIGLIICYDQLVMNEEPALSTFRHLPPEEDQPRDEGREAGKGDGNVQPGPQVEENRALHQRSNGVSVIGSRERSNGVVW